MSQPLLDALAKRLGSRVAMATPPPGEHPLWPEEAEAVARAIPSRKAEFAAGRAAARAALATLGQVPVAIPSGPDRAPIWPNDIIGSITHTQGLCIAAVARSQDISAIGLDAERAAPLETNVMQTILTEQEQRQFSAMSPLAATAVFSAKEAVYKALSPHLDEIWGFDAMTIRLDASQDRFEAHLLRDPGRLNCGKTLEGVLLQNAHHIVTALALPAQG